MPATVSDIAREVGKSCQLVSAVLNGGRSKSAASAKTRELILKEAERLGYRPNSAARAVSTGRFNAIGLLLSTAVWKSNITSTMLAGIQSKLSAGDLHLMVSGFPDETLTDDNQLPKVLRHMLVDGLIVKYDCQFPAKMVESLRACGLPLVWMNSRHPFDCVYPDDFGAGLRATEHLLALGHRRIIFADFALRPVADHCSSSDRLAGYSSAMQTAGLAQCSLNETPNFPLEQRIELAAEWLSKKNAPTAVVAECQSSAFPIIYAAALQSLRVPQDLSVITFEGRPVDSTGLRVTTLLIPEESMGREAAGMLIEKIAHPRRRIKPRVQPFGFDAGETCARRHS